MKLNAFNPKYSVDLSGASGVISSSKGISLGSNTPLVESGAGSVGSGPQAAPWDHVHPTGGGSSAFGSNSNRVSSVSAAGASSSNSRADHVHDGIATITASGSNTLNRGTVNLRPGTGIALALSNIDGGSGFDTVTITNIASGSSGGGGGGGGTGSFIGVNAIGASWETMAGTRQYCKSVTLGADTQLLSIDAYLRPSTDGLAPMVCTVLADNAGAPGVLVAFSGFSPTYLSNSASMPGAGRWVSAAIGAYLPAGTYWICVLSNGNFYDLAYDAGSDQYFGPSGVYATGAYPSAWAISTSARSYSIRARVLT